MSSITPEQAFEAAKVLWPNIKIIKKHGVSGATWDVNHMQSNIDWGSLTEWPPAPQKKYREPTQDDVGKVVEVRHAETNEWVLRTLVAVVGDKYRDRFACECVKDPYVSCRFWKHARIRIDEPEKPSWLPDGWRVLGEDEVIQKGDLIYIASRNDGLSDAVGSIGSTPRQKRPKEDVFKTWHWIRRIEHPEIYHHNGKKYRLAKDCEEAYLSDVSIENAMAFPHVLKKVQAIKHADYNYVAFDGTKWQYAFVEVKE